MSVRILTGDVTSPPRANPRYVDGSSPERQRLYVQASGREFLKRIYARDGYRCVRCSAPNRAGNPALRFDEANVVTLCRGCHGWVHSKVNSEREHIR